MQGTSAPCLSLVTAAAAQLTRPHPPPPSPPLLSSPLQGPPPTTPHLLEFFSLLFRCFPYCYHYFCKSHKHLIAEQTWRARHPRCRLRGAPLRSRTRQQPAAATPEGRIKTLLDTLRWTITNQGTTPPLCSVLLLSFLHKISNISRQHSFTWTRPGGRRARGAAPGPPPPPSLPVPQVRMTDILLRH